MAFSLVIFSCSSDDSDDSSDTSGNLLGTWVAVDVDYNGSSTTTFQGQTIPSTFVGEAYDVNYSLVFTENPNELMADGTYSIELTTTSMGQTQVDNLENLEFATNGTWERSGNELTIVSQGQTRIYTIVELTDSTFKMGIQTVEELSQNGLDYSVTINLLATYTRM
ncbi:lipocalin family protein [Subsaxibacter sp. CAU 1640]|uniref:lipocalin family protein n=1 Tax=Subsaxibacter sp. CAU 1640 TaxID=2933271 RepID=UPI002002C46A|nr:lipocalin family protein [Subsaxibacter sp. CAU 1640]MCK7590568.1 lipocalin family protein [Subsaxibacter sp. CAU 1640]